MPHSLHLMESTALFGGTTITDLDLDNSGGSSNYTLQEYRRGTPQFKKIHADSPLNDGKRLVSIRLDDVDEEIVVNIQGTGGSAAAKLDNLLHLINKLEAFCINAMNAQVKRNNGEVANYFWISDRPEDTSTKTYKSEVVEGEVEKPPDLYDVNMLAALAEGVTIRLKRRPYVSASTLTILNGVSADNGDGDYVDIAASGGTAITGDLPAPLSVKVVGGDTTTTRLLMALCANGTVANLKQIYWAKDATLTSNTASLTGNYAVTNKELTSNVAILTIGSHKHVAGDTVDVALDPADATFDGTHTLTEATATTVKYAKTASNVASTASGGTVTGEIDGNDTGNGTRTTAANTSENKTHRWVNTTNMADQAHRLQVYARLRCNTADRYSVRLRIGQTDGTNYFFPPSNASTDGFVTTEVVAVGTHSGNNWAWVYLGEIELPPVISFGATVYGIVLELYATCSNTSGSPTLDADGLWLFPVGEGANGTGLVQATFDFATGASGVNAARISAIPGDSQAALLNGSDVVTFPKIPEAGLPLFGMPEHAARLFMVLLDATNGRHNYRHALTVTVKHELRHASVIGVP